MEDVLGFAAFGGLERVAIIAGALLVGYWGYQLYVSGKPAGLAFLGISCVMLFGALLTGGSHVRSVGESMQLASSHTPDAAARVTMDTEIAADPADSADSADSAGSDIDTHSPQSPLNSSSGTQTETQGTPANSADRTGQPAADSEAQEPVALAAIEPDVLDTEPTDGVTPRRDRLPTAQELGGRIVSVKSGNLSLEWSPAPAGQ